MEKYRYISDEYVILENEILGKGSYGIVFKGFNKKKPSDRLAIKVIDISKIPEKSLQTMKNMIENEVNSLMDLDHPNIISFVDIKIDSKKEEVYIITEFCAGGDLSKLIGKISHKVVMKYFKQIVKALIYANKSHYIHRDIKPENILLSKGMAKIADFGFAKLVDNPDIKMKMTAEKGSYLYMAPEVYFQQEYSSKCDVWSAGILLYQLIYGKPPWFGQSSYDLFQNQILKEPLKFNPEINPVTMDLLQKMLTIDQEKRFSFEEISNHKALRIENVLSDSDDEQKGPPRFIEYLKNMGDFYGKLSTEVKEYRKQIGLCKSSSFQLCSLLKKCEAISFQRIQKVLSGESNIREIPSNMRGKSCIKSFKPIYEALFMKAQEDFKEYMSDKTSKSKEFTKSVLNDAYVVTEEFKSEYNRIFHEFIETFCENFDRKKKELLEDEDIDDRTLRLILKLIQMRKFKNLKTKFAFEKDEESEDPFICLEEEVKDMRRKELVRKVLRYKNRFIE